MNAKSVMTAKEVEAFKAIVNTNKKRLLNRLKIVSAAEAPLPIPPAVIDTGNKLPGVTYSIFQMNDAPPNLVKQLEKGKELLEKFLSLAGAVVQNTADQKNNPALVQDASAWEEAFSFFTDFFTVTQRGSRSLKQTTEGTQVARVALNFACNVIAAGIGDFQEYLTGVAEVLSSEAKKTDQAQTMLYTFCQHSFFENSSKIPFYLPQISYANTKFSLEESKHLGVCVDTHTVNLDLEVHQQVLTFNINSYMNDKAWAETCDDFLSDFFTKSVADKKNTLKDKLSKVKNNPNKT
ncbi:hypothetical protein RZO07_19040 [Pseudomonas protegens]|uniref:hypothetical protein n=1 Tax=Pseudomonas protegens TaxID=380021 RepID=UPI002936E0EA|nr:hypothetical protein [Pseudomonas protegens]WOE77420.1 hypothetical protein RZO07_19040 [Pseudomonas protegens]